MRRVREKRTSVEPSLSGATRRRISALSAEKDMVRGRCRGCAVLAAWGHVGVVVRWSDGVVARHSANRCRIGSSVGYAATADPSRLAGAALNTPRFLHIGDASSKGRALVRAWCGAARHDQSSSRIEYELICARSRQARVRKIRAERHYTRPDDRLEDGRRRSVPRPVVRALESCVLMRCSGSKQNWRSLGRAMAKNFGVPVYALVRHCVCMCADSRICGTTATRRTAATCRTARWLAT